MTGMRERGASGSRPVASNQDAIRARPPGDTNRLARAVAEPCDGCGTRTATGPGNAAIARARRPGTTNVRRVEDDLYPLVGHGPGGNAPKEGPVQAKLAVSQPHDPSEQEADRVARQVMRMREPSAPITQGAAEASIEAAAISVPSSIAPLAAGGQPLLHSERTFFEPRFGRDLSAVRVHTSPAAASMARSIKARAFTSGNAIAFAPSELRQDNAGRTLLAHELTHVVQNAGGDGILKRQGDGGVADAGVGDAGPAPTDGGINATRTRVFDGVTLSDDPAYTFELLQRMFLNSGFWAMRDFVDSFESDVSPRRPEAGVSDDPELIRDSAILTVLREQYQKLADDRDAFITEFDSHARAAGVAVVQDSERIVMSEAVRYGIRNLHIEFSTWLGIPELKGDVADNASTRGLAIAAQGLLDRKKKAEAAVDRYQEFTHGAPAIAELASARLHSQEDEIAAFRSTIADTQKDLDVFRVQVETRYPILAALSSDEDFKRDDLESLAAGREGPKAGVADVIVNQVTEKLGNIAKVKEGLEPGGDINLWRVPKLVAATRDELGVAPGTIHAKIIDEKVEEEKPSALTEILVGIVQLGLVLLAPLTEGLTLIPAAAISAGTAYEHFKEYETKSALRGTHFGAGALSAEEPSLFWLAADIVGAGFDVGAASGAALRIFRELAPAAKALRAGEVSEDAIRNLERHAGDVGGKTLAETVGRDARSLRSGSKGVGITAEEARQFEQVGTEVAEQEFKLGAQSAETIAGGKVTVGRSGAVWSCQSPCLMMRERFTDLLAREPKYLERLNEIEERAAKLAGGAEGDVARQGIAKEAATLEREMRTTSLPGDWTSPLKDSEGFEALKTRRGSVAAQLDHHPPGWTGKDEARFRYGLPEGEEAEEGYRWTLDENGSLRYDRLDANHPPRRYNAATGAFEDAAEQGFIAARRGTETSAEFAKLPESQQKAIKAAFKQRRELMSRRDALELLQEGGTIQPKELEELKTLYYKINEQSRQLGEHAAEGVMSGKGHKLYPLGKTHSTSGDFDQVWKVGDEFHIVEAKGGSGPLGSRQVSEGVRAQQGTIEYAKSIIDNMIKNGATPEIRKLGREMEAALASGKVKYVLVRASVATEGGAAVLRDIKVSEFILPAVN
jgi:hypothetical protein